MRFAARSMQLVVLASGSVRSRRAQDCSTLRTLPHFQSSRAVQLGMLASRQRAPPVTPAIPVPVRTYSSSLRVNAGGNSRIRQGTFPASSAPRTGATIPTGMAFGSPKPRSGVRLPLPYACQRWERSGF